MRYSVAVVKTLTGIVIDAMLTVMIVVMAVIVTLIVDMRVHGTVRL